MVAAGRIENLDLAVQMADCWIDHRIPHAKGSHPAMSTEARLRDLASEHLAQDREPDFDRSFADAGVSSLNAVAFMKLVEKEFGVSISAEQWAGIGTLRHLVTHLDS